ncbi:uncharacterized protein LOC131228074 [Magnolia sinica]|uniref:uncharacterized protein LOC131228074 n=1 Tax=Magnolia sinica TaxID=86752 RepID=UPI00265B5AA0|nr:uncharacterized protein LOC131228074 [Magnolia sinica]XP_058079889.1 uncharacterized protein LOC131228074 [Magnolia sinica]XP_058079890.1 uncharacterized protein LOC131228074 [Magnolia sinica]
MAAARQLLHFTRATLHVPVSLPSPHLNFTSVCNTHKGPFSNLCTLSNRRIPATAPPKASSVRNDNIVGPEDDSEGVSLGTMKLPPDTDVGRFETLLFQWANSLCQGANLPLPVPLKVDKIKGGVRLGFIKVEDGMTEVCVYIDCLVFAETKESGPFFQAVRNGPLKDQPPPGEPRIMRSLLQALKMSAEIARI